MTLINSNPDVNKKIDELVKTDYGTIRSTLAKRLGHENLVQIDKIVAKSFKDAKSDWSPGTVPNDPKNKIWQLITDNSSDLFCIKVQNHGFKDNNDGHYSLNLSFPDKNEAIENNVTLLFAGCQNNIKPDSRIALILKILGGYNSSDIARVLSKNEKGIIDEINDAKIKIISSNTPFEIPGKYTINERLNNVLDALFSIFELGFSHPHDKLKIFPEICHTVINLLKFLISHPRTNSPKARALLAYMLLCGSRLQAMKDKKGNLLNLKEQKRSIWDKVMISKGIDYLYSSAEGKEVSIYHLKAGVAAIHSTSSDYKLTNWKQIISLYNNYLELNDCPISELEKALVISRVYGAEEGLKCIAKIKDTSKIMENALLPLTLGNLNLQLHNYKKALGNFSRALELTQNSFEKIYINNKTHICEQRIKMTERYKHGLSF
ncbi:MAG: DUF6596 domain-containing protein [Thermodesulfobacteriota bacterium]